MLLCKADDDCTIRGIHRDHDPCMYVYQNTIPFIPLYLAGGS